MSVEFVNSSPDMGIAVLCAAFPLLILACLFSFPGFRKQDVNAKLVTVAMAVFIAILAAILGALGGRYVAEKDDLAINCESVESVYGVSFVDGCKTDTLAGRGVGSLLVPGFSSAQTGRFVQIEDGTRTKLEIVFEGKFVPVDSIAQYEAPNLP